MWQEALNWRKKLHIPHCQRIQRAPIHLHYLITLALIFVIDIKKLKCSGDKYHNDKLNSFQCIPGKVNEIGRYFVYKIEVVCFCINY